MIDGVKVIANTPCGRHRYMKHLAAHMQREHERGHVDEWVLFQNAYSEEDLKLAHQIAANWPWVKVFEDPVSGRGDRISRFFKYFTDPDAVYFRLDDDIVYIEENAIERLVRYRLAHRHPYIVFPTIVNNVRTSYHLQCAGVIPVEWGEVCNDMLDPVAWKDPEFVVKLHRKALAAIDAGRLAEEFTLPSGDFPDTTSGYISINCFAMLGEDMMATKDNVEPDEERHFSLWMPQKLKRMNARCGDAAVCHFAYHTQTANMDASGLLDEYARVSAPWLSKLPEVPFNIR